MSSVYHNQFGELHFYCVYYGWMGQEWSQVIQAKNKTDAANLLIAQGYFQSRQHINRYQFII